MMHLIHITILLSVTTNALPAPLELATARTLESFPDVTNLTALRQTVSEPGATQDAINDDSRILPFINGFDASYRVPQKKWDPALVNSIKQTLAIGQGKTEYHHLFGQAKAQVLCPGRYDFNPSTGPFTPFGIVYYAWLCEKPSGPQLQGKCPQDWHYGNLKNPPPGPEATSHYDILTSPKYLYIGCAFYQNADQHDRNNPLQGIWGCDLRW